MESPSFNKALYDCALECALRRRNKRCRNDFDSFKCNKCKYYVKHYINANPEHVNLFMMQAEMEADTIEISGGTHHFVFIILIALCLLFAWTTYTGEQERQERIDNLAPRAAVAPGIYQDIEATLRQVSRNFKDVNSDKLKNCIDASVLFYQYFPDKNKVCIMTNRNRATGMNHAFNCVLVDGAWRAVEPQAHLKGYKKYWMRDVWGNEYDASFNKDSTAEYIRYVKN